MTIKAVYENGVFRPIEMVALPEGTAVELTVESSGPPGQKRDPRDVAQAMREVAALAENHAEPDDGLVGSRDAERILYGGPKGAS